MISKFSWSGKPKKALCGVYFVEEVFLGSISYGI